MAITLYFAPGTRATRITFLLDELGVPWKKVTLDLLESASTRPRSIWRSTRTASCRR